MKIGPLGGCGGELRFVFRPTQEAPMFSRRRLAVDNDKDRSHPAQWVVAKCWIRAELGDTIKTTLSGFNSLIQIKGPQCTLRILLVVFILEQKQQL